MNKQTIFRAARTLARRHGVDRVLKKHIAEHLGCAIGLVNYYWGTMAKLRNAIVDEAKANGDMALVTGKIRRK